jgi:hypothetical protein
MALPLTGTWLEVGWHHEGERLFSLSSRWDERLFYCLAQGWCKYDQP